MKCLIYIVLSLFLLLFSHQSNSTNIVDETEKSQHTPPQKLDIYLLIGQSNMAGRAPIEGNDKDTLQNVFLFTGEQGKEWEKAANPLNKYSTIRKEIEMQRLGPGYSFAREIQQITGKEIGLVVNAKGGTKIELWAPGTEFYTEAVARTKAALKYGTLKGIV